jgi:hypothetical protein
LKHLFRSGTTISKEKENQFCSYTKDAEPNRLEILLKKFFIKFREIWGKVIYS